MLYEITVWNPRLLDLWLTNQTQMQYSESGSGWLWMSRRKHVWKYFAVIVTHRSYTKCPTPCHGSACELWYVHVKNNKPKKTLSVETQKKIVIWFLVYKNLWSHSHRGLQNAVIPKGHSWVSISISIFTYSREKIYIYI